MVLNELAMYERCKRIIELLRADGKVKYTEQFALIHQGRAVGARLNG
jgi:hypothetical protein